MVLTIIKKKGVKKPATQTNLGMKAGRRTREITECSAALGQGKSCLRHDYQQQMIIKYPESLYLHSWLLEAQGGKKVTRTQLGNPAKTHLEVPVIGCIVQRGVVIQPLGVDFGARSEQLLCHIVVTPVARLVQCCPACKQRDTQNMDITFVERAGDSEKAPPSTDAADVGVPRSLWL